MRRTSRSLAATAAVVACLAAAPADAFPPDITPYESSGGGVWVEGCPGGYDVLVEGSNRGRFTIFHDQHGDVVRITDWNHGTGTLINSEDPTKTVTGSSPKGVEWDLRDMTFTIRGMTFRNTIPGEGRVAHATGVLVFELLSVDLDTGDYELGELLHSGGKHPEFDEIDWCAMVD